MTSITQEIPRDDDRRLRLSSLMDGELDDAAARQALADLVADPVGRDDWALWHAAGDALRASEVAAFHSCTFGARVSAALADEPAIVAPRANPRNPHRTVRRIVLPGVAAAAAVAALSWVAVPIMLSGDEPASRAAVTPAAAVAVATQPDVVPPPRAAAVANSRSLATDGVQAVRFDRYMAAHGQMSGTLGLPRTSQYLLRDPGAVDAMDTGR
jgi:sigma-E factor negative regulatory protein RseA